MLKIRRKDNTLGVHIRHSDVNFLADHTFMVMARLFINRTAYKFCAQNLTQRPISASNKIFIVSFATPFLTFLANERPITRVFYIFAEVQTFVMANTPKPFQRTPFNALLSLLGKVLLCFVVFNLIGAVIMGVYMSLGAGGVQAILQGENNTLMLIAQGLIALGAFILPPLWFNARERALGDTSYFSFRRRPVILLLILTAACLFVLNPFLGWTEVVNSKMHLPAFMQGIEQWMRAQEDNLAQVTKNLLTIKSVPQFILAITVIAIIPAIGEELLFRGCLMTILVRLFKNAHVGIWVSAIVFSAIHMQFFGFIPRMLLGVLFGYIFYWSGNIYYSIFAHFLNNASVVVYAFYLQLNGRSLTELDSSTAESTIMIASSLVFASVTLFYFYQLSRRQVTPLKHEQRLG